MAYSSVLRASLFASALIASAACGGASPSAQEPAPDEPGARAFPILLGTRYQAGADYRVEAEGSESRSQIAEVPGASPGVLGFTAQAVGVLHVESLTEFGELAHATYRFESLVVTANDEPVAAAQAAVDVEILYDREGEPRYRVAEGHLPGSVRRALDLLFAGTPANALGASEPHQVGEEWPVDGAFFRRMMVTPEVYFAPEDVSGTVLLVSADPADNPESLSIRSHVRADHLRSQHPTPNAEGPSSTLEGGFIDVTVSGVFPIDHSLPLTDEEAHVQTEFQVRSLNPDAPSEAVRDMRMTYRMERTTMVRRARLPGSHQR